ncbi:MAG: HRDC domain-containing protein, partial [Planctomycetes bacterium]|nr:HRDC domain-containing protein [Planctomycetota bacterium]
LSGRPHAVLRSLATWRELQARERDKPRNHVVPEAVLLVIAERQPGDLAALRDVQGLSSAEVRRSGETLCALVAEARENDDDRPSPIATRVAGHVLKRLKSEVRRVAEPLGIEPGLLAPNRVLETLLENVARHAEEPLPTELRGWRREVVGERLLTAAEVEWSKRGNTE